MMRSSFPGGARRGNTCRADARCPVRERGADHLKPIAAVGEGVAVLEKAMVPVAKGGAVASNNGVVTAEDGQDIDSFIDGFVEAMKQHRHYHRPVEVIVQ